MAALSEVIAAIFAGKTQEVADMLGRNPVLAKERPSGSPSALLAAAYSRNPATIAEVRKHTEADACEAAALGDVPALEALLRSRPGDIAMFSGDGWTPLHLAAFFGHASAVALLLRLGASPTVVSRGPEGNHPLHAALAGADSAQIVQALLAAGADPGFSAASGLRPIHIAASCGDRATVDALLARGADPRVKSNDGKTASDIATERKFPELAQFLAERAAAR